MKREGNQKKARGSFSAWLFLAVVFFFCATVLVRFAVKNFYYDKHGADNAVVRFIMSGMAILEDAQKDEKKIDWASLYPFPEDEGESAEKSGDGLESASTGKRAFLEDRLINGFTTLKNNLELYCTTDLLGEEAFVKLGNLYGDLLRYDVVQGNSDIFVMNNGYFCYENPRIATRDQANTMVELYQYAKDLGIDFLFVQFPAKVSPYDPQLPQGAVEYSNENADSLLGDLGNAGVPLLDFRPVLRDSGYDWYSMFYKTDHHWTTQAGLFAAGVLAGQLNENYGFSFDLSLYEEDAYQVQTYEKALYGAQAKAINAPEPEYEEDYQTYLPDFDTRLHVQVPSKDVDLTGSFDKVMLDTSILGHIEDYEQRNPYGIVTVQNNAMARIDNLLPTHNPGKKVLIIQDSFSYYVTPYLALDMPQIVTAYTGSFTGSIRTLVERERPDMVLVALSAGQIMPLDQSHTSIYDMR